MKSTSTLVLISFTKNNFIDKKCAYKSEDATWNKRITKDYCFVDRFVLQHCAVEMMEYRQEVGRQLTKPENHFYDTHCTINKSRNDPNPDVDK
ncbi:CLUMA_CG008864, isoform A [Clunio marinus]|uniref:CLUMA_CG008864, isoform A n=1 Tax=Clunio marinus TaxID=568069 RepID=A0A1J1I4A3_9DIPT|nr:CLUMA_CG008864, isoform A [Clunio marinus]